MIGLRGPGTGRPRREALLALLSVVACERATTAPIEDEPSPPGPTRIVAPVDAAPAPALDGATAPTSSALREILEILAGRGLIDPVRRQSALAPDPTWDVHQVTMTEFRQTGRAIQIAGTAATAEHVIQLAKRFGIDPMFEDVAIQQHVRQGTASRFTIVMTAPAEDPATALVIRP